MSNFSDALKQLRLKYNYTQKELAEKLSVTQNAIHQWENEKREPNAEMVEKIADFFQVSPAHLMGWENNKSIDRVIADNIVKHRKGLQVSQEELADYMGLSVDDIKNMELGKIMPSANEIIKFAEALMISVNDLLGMPETSDDEKYYEFIHDMFYRNGYFIFETLANGEHKYWISNEFLFYEIDKPTFNNFTASIDNFISFSIQKMLNDFTPKQLKKKDE